MLENRRLRVFSPVSGKARYSHVVVVGYDILYNVESSDGIDSIYAYGGRFIIRKYKIIGGGISLVSGDKIVDSYNFTRALVEICSSCKSPIVVCYNLPLMFEISDIRHAISSGYVSINISESKIKLFGVDSLTSTNANFLTFANYPNIMIIDSYSPKKSITIVDIGNYTDRDIENNALDMFRQDGLRTIIDDDGTLNTTNAERTIAFIERYIARYICVLKKYNLGGLRVSSGSQAMQALKMTTQHYVVQKTDRESVREIERSTYKGGRVYCCGVGRYDGKCYYIDINSMYPYIGANYQLPSYFERLVMRPSIDELKTMLERYYIICGCYVSTERPIYPFTEGELTTYPVGSFHTTLHHPELSEAIDNDEIKCCHFAMMYNKSDWLKPYCDNMINARKDCEGENRPLDKAIIKRITNAIFGKLGQKGSAWVERPDMVHAAPYGVFWRIDPKTKKGKLFRVIDFYVEEMVKNVELEDTHFPSAGAVTAYGRMMLNKYHQTAGQENVLYACVDGMIVTQRGLQNLRLIPGIFGNGAGQSKVTEEGDYCIIDKPGRYVIGNKTVNTGYRRKDQAIYSSMANHGGFQNEHFETDGELVFRTRVFRASKEIDTSLTTASNLAFRFTHPCGVHQPIDFEYYDLFV